MSLKPLFAVSTLAVLAGCQGGPVALPALYGQRDAIQRVIDDIETRYNIAPRPSMGLRPEDEATKAASARLLDENAALRKEIEEMNGEWFKSLSTEQQLRWKISHDLITSCARTEVRHVVEDALKTPSDGSPAPAAGTNPNGAPPSAPSSGPAPGR